MLPKQGSPALPGARGFLGFDEFLASSISTFMSGLGYPEADGDQVGKSSMAPSIGCHAQREIERFQKGSPA